eukprot:scaffold833_cov352-Pavlova_lutheri.AAC.34
MEMVFRARLLFRVRSPALPRASRVAPCATFETSILRSDLNPPICKLEVNFSTWGWEGGRRSIRVEVHETVNRWGRWAEDASYPSTEKGFGSTGSPFVGFLSSVSRARVRTRFGSLSTPVPRATVPSLGTRGDPSSSAHDLFPFLPPSTSLPRIPTTSLPPPPPRLCAPRPFSLPRPLPSPTLLLPFLPSLQRTPRSVPRGWSLGHLDSKTSLGPGTRIELI